MRIVAVAVALIAASSCIDAEARQPYLTTNWPAIYPQSTSDDDSGCQLCHVQALGGQPWNSYGWELKQEFVRNGGDIDDAIVAALVEFEDSDGNPGGATNITEIEDNFQPGWTSGDNNSVYSCLNCNTTGDLSNVIVQSGQSPPGTIPASRIDPPAPLTNPITGGIPSGIEIGIQDIASGFVLPNLAVAAPGLSGYIFVVDQVGVIWQVDLSDGSKSVFLDISSQLIGLNAGYDERGLLGLAFHPDYASTGLFYTYQSEPVNGPADFSTLAMGEVADHQSVLSEWAAINPGTNTATVPLGSKRVLMRIDQPQFNHNGGMIAFGPHDDYLYISVGDGGSADDQGIGHVEGGNGQSTQNPLGTILRIDPAQVAMGGGEYSVPAGNDPNNVFDVDEIFAYGFRNVWRFSFDSTGRLFAGDVGQNDIEEVSLVDNGGNYGWNAKEGSFFFYDNGPAQGYVSNTAPGGVPPVGVTDPILEYDHDEGISIIGGHIYEGAEIPPINNYYVFGDLNGRLFYSTNLSTFAEFRIKNRSDLGFFLFGSGVDENGEIYLLGADGFATNPMPPSGVLVKLVPADSIPDEELCFPIPNASGGVALVCI